MRQYVTFRIGNDMYGLDVRSVREVNRYLEITPVAHAPVWVRGVVNLRGQVLTVIDLAICMDLPPVPLSRTLHNVVLHGAAVGILVEEMGDVVVVEDDLLEPLPANRQGKGRALLEAVVELPEGLLTILSPEQFVQPLADKL